MNISDLNVCETVKFANNIVGGASADTDGYAIAGPGVANAYVVADAEGDITYTNALAQTIVREKKNVTISKAKIKGDASALDADGDKAKDKIRETDVYVLRHNK